MSFESVNTLLKPCTINLEESNKNIESISKSLAVLSTTDLSIENINTLLQSLGEKLVHNIVVNGIDNIVDIVYKSTGLTVNTDKRVINDSEFLMSYKSLSQLSQLSHFKLTSNDNPQNTNNFLIFFIGIDNKIITYQKFNTTNMHLKNDTNTYNVEKTTNFDLDNIVYHSVNYIELIDNNSKYKLVIAQEGEAPLLEEL